MRRTTTLRRGSCLFEALLGIAIIGLLLLVAGTIAFFIWNPKSALESVTAKVKAIARDSVTFEAPGSMEVDLKAGGAALFFPPKGEVGDKTIPMPPIGVLYTVSITDSQGNPVKFEPNVSPRQGQEPFYFLGFTEIAQDGKYTVEVKASDNTTPAAISIASGRSEDFIAMLEDLKTGGIGVFGGCGALCGLSLLVVGGIAAIFARRAAKADPLAV